jgi:signal transduction histidine kinase
MKFGIKFRLVTLALVVALMGALIALATLNSRQQAAELRAGLSQVDSESFRIADQFRDSMRELNNTMLRYGIGHEPELRQEFLDASQKLDLWIDEQKPRLKTPHELEILQQIDTIYNDYLSVAKELQIKIQASGSQSVPLAEFVPIRAQSQRLMDLGQALAKAHYQSRDQLAARANQILTQFRWLTLGSLGLLFVFGVALAGVVYRDMIAPLRVQLGESRALAERHEKLASLGMLAAGVAHEIRNPLTAIKAALFIQQKKFQPGSQERADVKIVEREILRLERIVNDFLQFAGPSEPKPSTIPADLLLLEVQQFFSPQFAAADIQLVLEASAPMRIHVDAAQIKQVLINLVQNAADAIGRNGKVTLRARHDRKRLANGETDVVILEVADTGKGISSEVQKRLFDPFFTTKDTGTGLGLPIASGIVQKHGGLLQYQTQVNYGTTFGIVLPQATA